MALLTSACAPEPPRRASEAGDLAGVFADYAIRVTGQYELDLYHQRTVNGEPAPPIQIGTVFAAAALRFAAPDVAGAGAMAVAEQVALDWGKRIEAQLGAPLQDASLRDALASKRNGALGTVQAQVSQALFGTHDDVVLESLALTWTKPDLDRRKPGRGRHTQQVAPELELLVKVTPNEQRVARVALPIDMPFVTNASANLLHTSRRDDQVVATFGFASGSRGPQPLTVGVSRYVEDDVRFVEAAGIVHELASLVCDADCPSLRGAAERLGIHQRRGYLQLGAPPEKVSNLYDHSEKVALSSALAALAVGLPPDAVYLAALVGWVHDLAESDPGVGDITPNDPPERVAMKSKLELRALTALLTSALKDVQNLSPVRDSTRFNPALLDWVEQVKVEWIATMGAAWSGYEFDGRDPETRAFWSVIKQLDKLLGLLEAEEHQRKGDFENSHETDVLNKWVQNIRHRVDAPPLRLMLDQWVEHREALADAEGYDLLEDWLWEQLLTGIPDDMLHNWALEVRRAFGIIAADSTPAER